MTPTPLLDRIRRDEKVIELRRTPRWIQRMREGQLTGKDMTEWRPQPPKDAA